MLGLDQHPHLLSKLCPSDSEDSDKPSAEPARNLPGTPDSASPIIFKDKKLFLCISPAQGNMTSKQDLSWALVFPLKYWSKRRKYWGSSKYMGIAGFNPCITRLP